MLVIDQSQNDGAVEVQAGDSFRIELSENPTTGYRWYLNPLVETSLRVVENSFELAQGGYGAGGVRHWTLSADRAGVVRIQIERKRGRQAPPAEIFTVTIDVKAC